ncbi:SusC/RagA family TonB-linked outer membrane protein [Algoriphagus zhangzhouensis]|uniref:TonB-linked outer membrane protein, SusC/RagA family n=1 Tax=Algoriphagus zhangzhouensis TaxID=1073327 RepID=A0A1M7Z7N2_9BACT|nr:SusC/RagA family TonB-linked outer membrane protein [Algoriphagus zhangzhouensis]TDY49345.1 TonB-linked SusC/RagA family outer membrane protein [Algoriphagus zhangzhouensis]SHO60802.1 TonB-linked outer membrane protein, SusC/RagA family [Algoriphagus zhangzhouensis]
MRKILSLSFGIVLLILVSMQSYAQSRLVTGTVTGEADGLPIPGVTVLDKTTQSGTTTDIDGKYSISVNENSVLVFSFIGFTPKEFPVGNQTVLDVSLSEDISELNEVVVTAFGLEKDKKALGYSVTQLDGDRFTQARAINAGNALSGKVAGVNVTPPATGAAGSTRVVIRGGSSLTGNDQPLYVVNGIPIESGNLGNAGMWGGNDAGDGLASISPDDIESMSVLKGNAAAALYGARAANGVILITTKSGKARQGVGVTFSSNIMFDNIWDQTDWQRTYGSGRDGRKSTNASEAMEDATNGWGPMYDGTQVPIFDGSTVPYSFTGEGLSDFYKTGSTLTNSIAFDGGNETTNYRFSLSDLTNSDIMPNADFKRRVANVNVNSKLGKFTLGVSGQYSLQEAKNRPRLSDSPGNANYSMLIKPGHIPLDIIKGPTDKLGALEDGSELRYQQSIYQTNPYWAAYQFYRFDKTNRILGNISLQYDITDWLYVRGRIGLDFQSRVDDSSEPYGTAYKPRGDYNVTERTIREDNADLFIGFNKTFGNFTVDGFVGGNRMRRTAESLRGGGNDLVIPFWHSVRNVAAPTITYGFSEYGINSYFASANVDYKNMIFLGLTAREDQFSTLSPDNFKLFYPSVSLSAVISDMVTLPDFFTFMKVRGSWGQAGGGAPNPYALNLTYGLVGNGHLGGVLGQINNGSIPNSTLKPYTSTEYEFGADLRFLDNRIGLDVAYYNRLTKDDILNTGISSTSGFGSTTVNIGELRNKGIELLLNVTPIVGDFRWDVSFNYANNQSEVLSLGTNAAGEPIEFINLGNSRLQRDQIRHIVGEPLGMITGYKQLEINGQKVYDDNGYPVTTAGYETIAQGRHPISGGISNTFSYKGFKLYALIDFRKGGSLVSGTNYYAYSNGLHQETLVGRDGTLTVTGVDANGEALTRTIGADPSDQANYTLDNYYQAYARVTENIVYDAAFGKLRELNLGYTFSKSVLGKTPIQSLTLSFVGRNLALLWSKVPNVDPESAYAVNGNNQGLEYFGMPTNRSFGFNLSATF